MVTDKLGNELQEGDRVIFINTWFGPHLDFGKITRIWEKDCSPDWMRMNSITVSRLDIETENAEVRSTMERWFFDIPPGNVVKVLVKLFDD